MNNAEKIRQLLKSASVGREWPRKGLGARVILDEELFNESLNLLFCDTCNNAEKVVTGIGEDGRNFDGTSPEILEPCPDCQSDQIQIDKMKYDLAIIHEHTNLVDENEKEAFVEAVKMIRNRSSEYENLRETAGPLYDGEDE